MPLKVKGIGVSKHESEKFALTGLYILSFNQEGLEIYTCIKYKLYLIEGLKINMLIGNNVFYTKGFSINLANVFTHIPSYGVDIVISAQYHSKFWKHKVLANTTTSILSKFKAFVPFWQISLSDLRDFLFHSSPQ